MGYMTRMMPSIGHAALIVAAGKGTRFGKGTEPKQYYVINGRALLCHAALCLINHPRIDYVQVVIHPDDRALYDEAMADVSLPPPVDGGATRQQSVHHGLEALRHLNPASVLVHDSARPIVPHAVIDRLLDALTHHDAAIPCLPIHDTVKEHHNNHVTATLNREHLVCVQTPQAFSYPLLLNCHRHATSTVTDDAALLEQSKTKIALVDGSRHSMKVTTADDIKLVSFYMKQHAPS